MDAVQLKQIPLFSDASDEELKQVAAFAQSKVVPEGEVVLEEGGFSRELLAIEEGTAAIGGGPGIGKGISLCAPSGGAGVAAGSCKGFSSTSGCVSPAGGSFLEKPSFDCFGPDSAAVRSGGAILDIAAEAVVSLTGWTLRSRREGSTGVGSTG